MVNNVKLTNGRYQLTRWFIGQEVTIEADIVVNDTDGVVIYSERVISRPSNMSAVGAIKVITNGLPGGPAAGETRVVAVMEV
jgi:hypothetical protein